jgi:hypothetical protein
MNKKRNAILIIFAAGFLFWSCDHGQVGGADKTDTYYHTDVLFNERMAFLCGVWYSQYDGYRIRTWSGFNTEDKARARSLFPDLNLDADDPKNGDYVILFDDNADGESWGFGYMGLVRAINIFNGDKNRGAVIIEYFEGADPLWLSGQGLERGEKPFFGIYYKVIDSDTVQIANPVDLAAMYAGESYYTEKGTLNEAVKTFNVENEAEFVSWSTANIQSRAE